jgi:YD repeat-containing protein
MTQLTYDGRGRLALALTVTGIGAGERAPLFAWRSNPHKWLADTVEVKEKRFIYAEDGRLVQLRVSRTSSARSNSATEAVFVFAYDDSGRRVAQVCHQLHPPSNRPPDTETYHYQRGRLVQVDVANRYSPLPDYNLVIEYDERGNEIRLTNQRASGWSTKFEYDRRNRLVRRGDYSFEWSDSNRLLWNGLLKERYTYDAHGRLASATSEYGGGYHMVYSEGCPRDFSDSSFAPSTTPPLPEHTDGDYWEAIELPSARRFGG